MSFVPTNCQNIKNMPGYCLECGNGFCLYNREQLREWLAGKRETVDMAAPSPQYGEVNG